MIPGLHEPAIFLGINLSLDFVDAHDSYPVRKRRSSPEQANTNVDLRASHKQRLGPILSIQERDHSAADEEESVLAQQ